MLQYETDVIPSTIFYYNMELIYIGRDYRSV